MSTIVASPDVSATAHVLSGAMPPPLPQLTPSMSLHIAVPDFQLQLALSLREVIPDWASNKVTLSAVVDPEVEVSLVITGEANRADDVPPVEQVFWIVERMKETARTDFVYSTLMSMLTLAEQVSLQIPEAQFDVNLRFDRNLLNISQMLQQRQLAYRIMVIERATGLEFALPANFSAEQVKDVTLIYYAITQRSFAWPIDRVTVTYPATDEVLKQLTYSVFGSYVQQSSGIEAGQRWNGM